MINSNIPENTLNTGEETRENLLTIQKEIDNKERLKQIEEVADEFNRYKLNNEMDKLHNLTFLSQKRQIEYLEGEVFLVKEKNRIFREYNKYIQEIIE